MEASKARNTLAAEPEIPFEGSPIAEASEAPEQTIARLEAELAAERAENARLRLENARIPQLERLATVDTLTEIPNRRHFMERMHENASELIRAIASGEQANFSLIIFDIDHFKWINDTFGHPGGDLALKLMARAMEKVFRDTDVIARYGGEEFVVIIPELGKEEATKAAERFRREVEETYLEELSQALGRPVPKGSGTVSMGITDAKDLALNIPSTSELRKLNHKALDTLINKGVIEPMIERADSALYNAKKYGPDGVEGTGRNRVAVYAEGMEAPKTEPAETEAQADAGGSTTRGSIAALQLATLDGAERDEAMRVLLNDPAIRANILTLLGK